MPSLHATLNTGAQIPLIGLGCWMLKKVDADNPETYQMVRDALDVGYRHLDTVCPHHSQCRGLQLMDLWQ